MPTAAVPISVGRHSCRLVQSRFLWVGIHADWCSPDFCGSAFMPTGAVPDAVVAMNGDPQATHRRPTGDLQDAGIGAQLGQARALLVGIGGDECRRGGARFRRRQLQHLARHDAIAHRAVALLEHREGLGLRRGCQEEPARLAPGVEYRRMAPALCVLGLGRQAGLAVGRVRIGQALRLQFRLAAAIEHAVQRGQVLRGLDAASRAEQDGLGAVPGQAVQPQALDLVQLLGVVVGAVVLVVVVQAEQREDLVDRVDQRRVAAVLSLPSSGP